jgi:hypothetical protein
VEVTGQTWNSPTSADSPPVWTVTEAPPAWFEERVTAEGWPAEALDTLRTALLEGGVGAVALTLDVRGATIDFDGKVPQPLNPDNAQPLHSALGRGLDRLQAMAKAQAGNEARRNAPATPPD